MSIPRIWPYVRSVWIGRISVSETPESHLLSAGAELFGKLTNVDALDIWGGDLKPWPHTFSWTFCLKLFSKCSFQLHHLSCPFIPDKAFVTFLTSQKSLYKFECLPTSATTRGIDHLPLYEIPPSALQSLRVYSFLGDGNPNMDNILHDRPIAHFRTSSRTYNTHNLVQDLKRTSCALRSLHLLHMYTYDVLVLSGRDVSAS
jgi:hypothetical protein